MKKIFLSLIFLLAFAVTVMAGETSVQVPVTINVTGNCVLTTPSFSKNTDVFFPASKVKDLDNYTFSYSCTPGINFSLKFNPDNSLLYLVKSSSRRVKLRVYDSTSGTQLTNNSAIQLPSSAPEGSISLVTKLECDTGYGCSSVSGVGYIMEPGTYSITLGIKAEW
jgi:type 1 fimbria pilin